MPRRNDASSEWTRLMWPALAAAEAGAAMTRLMFGAFAPAAEERREPERKAVWASENRIALETGVVRLREFSAGATVAGRRPILVCAPFALHDARVADLCEGHSLMAALRAGGAPLYLVEWLSAKEEHAWRRIDDYLADLNVLVDEIGGCSDFIGLCQGGWLSLIYAARFPAKAGRLVLAGAPIDLEAESSPLSALAHSTPIEAFREIVREGGGRAIGAQAMRYWRNEMEGFGAIQDSLQSDLPQESPLFLAQAELFRDWSEATLDLPGAYYLEVVERFYKRNELARGDFVALGKRIDLKSVRQPLYLIGAKDDKVATPEQTFACARLVGTPRAAQRRKMVAGGHLSLFLGAKSLKSIWPDVLRWLAEPPPAA